MDVSIVHKEGKGFANQPDSDTISRVPLVAPTLAEVPCTDIVGLVVYDLPGRDCAAKASNGELKSGELSRYQKEYIDRKLRSSNVSHAITDIASNRCCYQGCSQCSHCSSHRT